MRVTNRLWGSALPDPVGTCHNLEPGTSHAPQRCAHAPREEPAGEETKPKLLTKAMPWPREAGRPAQQRFSPAYRSAVAMFDTIAFLMTIAINVTILVKSQRMRLYSQLMRLAPSVVLILATVLQRAWYCVAPDSYLRMRPKLLLGNRFMRFFFTLPVPYRTRLWFQDPATTTANLASFLGDVTRPTAASAFVHTMVLSGAIHALVSSINLPLPLLPQILSQTAFFALLTVTNALPAAACLAGPLLARPAQDLCTVITDIFVLLVSGFSDTRIDPDVLAGVCSADAPLVLVVFCLMYFAVIIPVYVAYRFEQYTRHCMHRDVAAPLQPGGWREDGAAAAGAAGRPQGAVGQEAAEGLPHGTASMVVCDMVLLVLLGAVAWLLSVMLLPALKLVMLPV